MKRPSNRPFLFELSDNHIHLTEVTEQDTNMARINDYTNSLSLIKGYEIRYRNPNFFKAPTECSYFYSDRPDIIEAYKAAGFPLWGEEQEVKKEEPALVSSEEEKETSEVGTPQSVDVPENWKELSYWQKRTIALSISPEEDIKNKGVAEAVIETYLASEAAGE